jgi:hypothetical protein
MTNVQTGVPRREKPLRLWPGVVAVILQWLAWFGVPAVLPHFTVYGLMGGLACALAVLVWWVFFSGVPHFERWGAFLVMMVAVPATPLILDPSIVGGLMGRMFWVYVIPGLCLALVVWAVVSRYLAIGARRVALVAAILIACGAWALVRTDGITGDAHSKFAWRWKKTFEQELLARTGSEPLELHPAPAAVKAPEPVATPVDNPKAIAPATHEAAPAAAKTGADWPGFRGPHRDGIIPGVRISTDWSQSPPVQMWRRPIGPGWSSFAVRGDLLYTQEQRGDNEVVACHSVTTGKPVWSHRDATRFYESNGGAGPRGTPTLSGGRVYTFGATGILNALDARDGTVAWSRNVASDTGRKVPGWGFASSPLVVDGMVIVAAGGELAAYDLATGNRRWLGPKGGAGYSSPHLMTIDGVEQVLLLSGAGATSVAPADGKVLWKYSWPTDVRIVQPALASDSDVLMGIGEGLGGSGMRRIAVAHGTGGWTVQERWTTNGLKPNFNDFVVHEGHAFGFDGSILACIDLQDGKRKWKGGRYGNGQLVLLPDQHLLLVLSEEGELALVGATPDRFTEIARFPAMQDKTWNHPVLAGNVLLVRNGQEMVAFRLSLAGG